jgi:hypothetical protein
MTPEFDDILRVIATARPANEAEVETKILLHIFRLLGFTDIDRADKPTVTMHYGREVKLKEPDFIIYDGLERTLANALITVEAKAVGNPIETGRAQAKSYAAWAGTPFYVVCNGESLLAVKYIPGAQEFQTLTISIKEISDHWQALYKFLSRAEVILAKERLAYLSYYLPNVETLPPSEFFKEYLNRLSTRFTLLAETREALIPPVHDQQIIPKIPVNTRLNEGTIQVNLDEKDIAAYLLNDKRRLFIEGAPGSGKSTLCKRVVNHLAKAGLEPGARIIPIYIPLLRYVPDNASDALTYACTELGVRVFPNLYQESLKHAQVILILDGVDEVYRSGVSRAKLDLLTRDCSYTILLTSRPIVFENTFSHQKITFAKIRNLTDEELFKVFKEYIGDQKEIERFFSSITPALRSALHSPLFALMAIRIAQSYSNWTSLSTYKLFEQYVSALHTFFNADTVRGSGKIISFDEVLSALSKVAISLQEGGEFVGLHLDALAHEMREAGYEEGFTALINIGIVTGAGGRLVIAHKSFQEFAIARYLLKCIQNDDINGFVKPRTSEFIYQLIHTEIGTEEEARLNQWLSLEEEQVREYVLGILGRETS